MRRNFQIILKTLYFSYLKLLSRDGAKSVFFSYVKTKIRFYLMLQIHVLHSNFIFGHLAHLNLFKGTHRVKAPSNKTPALRKSMNMGVGAVDTLNQ